MACPLVNLKARASFPNVLRFGKYLSFPAISMAFACHSLSFLEIATFGISSDRKSAPISVLSLGQLVALFAFSAALFAIAVFFVRASCFQPSDIVAGVQAHLDRA